MNARGFLSLLFLIGSTGCGGTSSVGTGPSPTPTAITVTGTITETQTGAPVSTFSQTVPSLPAMVTVSAQGYVTRQALIGSASPTVDLIKEAAPFDLGFYQQLVRNGLDAPGMLQPVTVLTANPSIYLQTSGLSAGTVASMEAAARAVMPALTGGRINVAGFETGESVRAPQAGWIVAELVLNVNEPCGRATVGLSAGHVWLNVGRADCTRPLSHVFAHELGHAVGFWHVSAPTALMSLSRPFAHPGVPSDAERYHAAIAYHRQSGNRDPDVDSSTSTPLRASSAVIILD